MRTRVKAGWFENLNGDTVPCYYVERANKEDVFFIGPEALNHAILFAQERSNGGIDTVVAVYDKGIRVS